MQEGFIFNDSIEKNITLGTDFVDQKKLIQAVKIANIQSFIESLPISYATKIGITRDRLNEQLLRLWEREKRTVVFVTHSIPEAAFLSSRIVVMSARPGRIVEVIESDLPTDRTLDIRESPEFMAIAHRLRVALAAGHAEQ